MKNHDFLNFFSHFFQKSPHFRKSVENRFFMIFDIFFLKQKKVPEMGNNVFWGWKILINPIVRGEKNDDFLDKKCHFVTFLVIFFPIFPPFWYFRFFREIMVSRPRKPFPWISAPGIKWCYPIFFCKKLSISWFWPKKKTADWHKTFWVRKYKP